MRTASRTPTPQELEIMKVVWSLGEATGRQVYEALRERRPVAYTTVMTMLRVLETKGHLTKRRGQTAHLYTPARPKRVVVRSMIREFLDRVFDGSVEPLLVHLVRDRRLTEAQLDELLVRIRESE